MHLMCCCVLLLVFSVMHNVVYISDFADVKNGYTFLWFCILYVVAAYFRLHVPEKIKLQRMMLPGYILACFVICGERFAAYFITPYIFGRVVLTSLFYSYNSIFVVAATLCLFQFCRGLRINGRMTGSVIAALSPLVFAVYLIHEQDTLRPHLWRWLHPGQFAESPMAIPYVLVCTSAIFLVCCAIEWIRGKLSAKLGLGKAVGTLCDRVQEKTEELFSKVE